MHGEYKTPGGKLVAVDLEVVDDHLKDVVVSGDFFLYPEEALTNIIAALDGLPADLTVSEYAEKVMLALPRGTELLGCSPEAIATAVRRALAGDGEDGGA
jgi:lipoate-protein ligase A